MNIQGNTDNLRDLFLKLYNLKRISLKSIEVNQGLYTSTNRSSLTSTEKRLDRIRKIEKEIQKEILKINLNCFDDILSENELNEIYWDLEMLDINEFTCTLNYYLEIMNKKLFKFNKGT